MIAPAVPHQPRRDGPAHIGGPSLTGRALLALAFLLGFYLLAGVVIGGLVGANVALYAVGGRTSGQLVMVTLVIAAASFGASSSSPVQMAPTSPGFRSTSTASPSSSTSSVPWRGRWGPSRPPASSWSPR